MDTVYNLDEGIPTPFTDAVRSGGSVSAKYSEWTEDDLEDPALANAIVDGWSVYLSGDDTLNRTTDSLMTTGSVPAIAAGGSAAVQRRSLAGRRRAG